MDGIILTPLKIIPTIKGDVFHALKKSDIGFTGFGEAYFSCVKKGEIKGWKKHLKMVLNIIVPCGEIEFVIYNENTRDFFNVTLSINNYQRLTINPGLWVAFRGKGNKNMLLNIASIEHDPTESINIDLNAIEYQWIEK